MKYDSTSDTLKHIERVAELLNISAHILTDRGNHHDHSKLFSPEKEIFDEETPKLAALSFGTKEYDESLQKIKPALDHHYKCNSHHPQYYENGIDGMDLFDVVEMFVDWIASGERHIDGDILKSIEINTNRFNLSPQLVNILKNTIKNFK